MKLRPISMPEKKMISPQIEVKGARVHNLKNIDVTIRRNSFTVITGLSGSGKSSLAFDTIYAEGQRRYVESLSSYARQFLGRMNKPEVDYIKGLPPAIAIEQKVNTRNPRSTVGTTTEIYDYLKLLFARIGRTFSPVSGTEVKKETVTDVVDFLISHQEGTKALILAPFPAYKNVGFQQLIADFKHTGINRVEVDGQILKLDELSESLVKNSADFCIVIDRIEIKKDDDSLSRFADSVQDAYRQGDEICIIHILHEDRVVKRIFSNKFECDGILFEEPSIHMFSFNNPLGACPKCEGYGKVIGIDEDLVIPDKNLSVFQDAVVCWKGEKMQEWKNELIYHAGQFEFPVHKPVNQLSPEQYELLWTGNRFFMA